ncbi:MAG: tRNA-dihydrouridine synthase family protein [Acidobacteriota bacterium]
MPFKESLAGAVVMGPMTKGSNLPYRRLCVELGARVLVSEMTVARRLKQKRRGEFALIRRAPQEPTFGVQLCGNKADELAWAAALVESRGADFVDLNLGCPIDHFTRKGLGAALGRQPNRVRRIVEAMRAAVAVPVTVKIRLGWKADERNYLDLAKAAVDGGAAALTVHGRTREARYRHPADWDAISEIAAAVPIPVIGNGDLLFEHEVRARLAASGCVAVMTARGALIKPWLFREVENGEYWDITADERVAIYRRYVELALEHWQEHSTPSLRPREFLRWHVGFWVRYAPRRADGTWPTMQERESFVPRSPLEALLARNDDAALEYITTQLMNGEALTSPPEPDADARELEIVEAG